MEILFLLTGLLCAILVPVSNIEYFGIKGVFFFIIMALFISVVIAYATLSIAKFLMAKLDFLRSKTIISWNLDHKPERKPSPLPYAISAAVGLITGVFLYFQQVPLTSTLLIALAVLFELLGWWLLAQKRVQSKRKEMPDFLLSHMGLIFHEKISVFNGYNKGITQVDVKDGILALTIKNRRQEYTLQLDIPEEKAEDVRSFITDMNDYFNGDAHAEE